MNITIIGAGNMGRGIGTRAVAGGHSVTFVDSNPEVAEKAAADVKASAKNGAQVSAASLGNVQLGDVVVLAVWYGTNIEIAKQLGVKLAGKVVVDIANPLNATYDGLATAPDSSSAEDLAKAIASGASVVKAFNTTYASTLLSALAGSSITVAGVTFSLLIAALILASSQFGPRLIRNFMRRPRGIGKYGGAYHDEH